MSNQVKALVLLHWESGCWFLTPNCHQQLQHKNDHCEYPDVQQEMHTFFQELVLVILLWELQSLYQTVVVAEVVVLHL